MSATPADPAPPGGRAWSLAARLTVGYAGASFAIVLLTTGALYWAMAGTLDREDDEYLADRARAVRAAAADPAALRRETEESGQARQYIRLFVRVLGPGDRVVAETAGMAAALPASVFPPPGAEISSGIDVSPEPDRLYRVVAVRAAGPGGEGRVVQVGMDRTQEAELLDAYRWNLLAVLVGAVAACGAAGYWIARRGLRPVRAIAGVVGRVRPSHLGERIATAGLPTELTEVAGPLNAMLDRLEGSFDRLGRFTSDIAHELRTPVNNLRGGIEVALGRPRTPDEYREILGSSLEECGRLTRLVEALLFLARAEDPKTQVARDVVDVAAELAAVREAYEPAAAEAGVRLEVAAPPGLRAAVNRPLFQRAVVNLVNNALAHTPAGGEVRLSAVGVGGETEVTVTDTGRGVPAADLPHVFDRFYRADPARSSGGGNLGLGLAIVKRIMDIHGGTAALASAPGGGTRVTLYFPSRLRAS